MPSVQQLILIAILSICSIANADDWPQFRGPSGNATASDSDPPTTWSDSENIVWKTALPGRGASSPIVSGKHVFLTAYTGFGVDAQEPGDKANLRLHVLCFERNSGKLLWDKSIKASPSTQKLWFLHMICICSISQFLTFNYILEKFNFPILLKTSKSNL